MSLFQSLQAAARLMVRQEGFQLSDISFSHLAKTYGTTPEKAEETIKIAMNGGRRLPEEIAAHAPKQIASEEVTDE